MIKIGMLIADRYEVLEKVGTGGMSDVYKAKDHRLNRMVAVKVLKQEFSENATFVSKFRVEAQAAAGLMHPNIVNVYDVGEEKGTYYIIMELVNGITLKRYIEKRKRLSTREAVTVAIQVAMGLAAAHRGHIIHRDIKPQNIIISKEGKVKVTDFGIAKASTSNTITSNVMGSVHYTSPEQARGGYSDEKSDVYSLGVTLYEMLTGKVPYDGETTVAIALQHIQDPFPSPREIVPDLPYSVEQIVLKCCEKSPDRRYQTMDELASDLRHSLSDPEGTFVHRMAEDNLSETRSMTAKDREEIRRRTSASAGTAGAAAMAAKAGTGANAGAAANAATAAKAGTAAKTSTAAGAPAAAGAAGAETGGLSQETRGFTPVSAGSREQKTGSLSAGTGGSSQGNLYSEGGKGGEDQYPPEDDMVLDNYPEEDQEDEEIAEDERRLDRIIQILSVVAVVVIGIVIILVAMNRRAASAKKEIAETEQTVQTDTQTQDENTQDDTTQEQEQEDTPVMAVMPKVVGKTQEDAEAALERANLKSSISYGTSDVYEDGVVMDASVREGERIEEGTVVALTVAKVKMVTVTDVTGKKQADAEKELQQLGLMTAIEEVYSEDTREGYVENQDPGKGREVAAGTVVTLYVSQGPDRTGMVQVPNILGMTEQEASAALLQVGLTPGETTVTDTSGRYEPGIVIGQSIEKDEYVEEGTRIDMELSGEPRYSYSARIEAPRYSEDPDYEKGTPVTLTIRTDDGKELLNVTTSEFPYQVSFTGIPYSEATLYLEYTNVTIEYSQTGETGAAPETTEHEEKKELTRKLVFTKD